MSRFLGQEILWEDENGFIIIKDSYALLKPERPTATLWHRCEDRGGDASMVRYPQDAPYCSGCRTAVPAALVGFWELVRYGQEQG